MNSLLPDDTVGEVEITELDGQRNTLQLLPAHYLRWKLVRWGMWPVTALLLFLLIRQVVPTGNPFFSSPKTPPSSSKLVTVINGLTFISVGGILTARHSHGSTFWRIPTHALSTTVLAVSQKEVFIKVHWQKWFRGELEALRSTDGVVLWYRPYTDPVTLVVRSGVLFLNNWTLQALRERDGGVLWRYQNPRGLLEDAPMLHDNGTISVQNQDGAVISLRMSDGMIVSPHNHG